MSHLVVAPALHLRRWSTQRPRACDVLDAGVTAYSVGATTARRCGARVRGLDAGRISCQRCLAPVTCRAIDTAREIEVLESTEPAAA